MRVFIAADHAGYELKQKLLNGFLHELKDYDFIDLGTRGTESVDYPDFADLVAKKVNHGDCMGILLCGSGQGMAMRANRYPNVRAALCWTPEVAKLAREHNSANILCLGARLLDESTCVQIVKTFFTTAFAEGRHTHRVRKMERPC